MKLLTKSLVALIGTMTLAIAPAMANAERVYFLVGVRHIFRIGLDRDSNLQQRIEIEKDYADGVAADRDTFQKNVDGGADSNKESDLLNDDLDRLADDRDKHMGALFERADEMRDRNPELHIEGDGPYQVMGIDYHVQDHVEIFERFVVYAPWPGYVVVGRPYGGWVFGIEYGPTAFFGLYSGWHEHYYHGERFHDGFYGHHGPVRFAPQGFIDRRPTVVREGRAGRPGNGPSVRTGGYGRSTGISSSGRSSGNQVGGFGRSTSGGTRGSSSETSSTGTRTGGYGRSSGTSNDTSRSGGVSRSSGSTGSTDRRSGGSGRSSGGSSAGTQSSGASRGIHDRSGSSGSASSGSSRSSGGGTRSGGSTDDKKKGN